MDFRHSPRTLELLARLQDFMRAEVYPNEALYYEQIADAQVGSGSRTRQIVRQGIPRLAADAAIRTVATAPMQ